MMTQMTQNINNIVSLKKGQCKRKKGGKIVAKSVYKNEIKYLVHDVTLFWKVMRERKSTDCVPLSVPTCLFSVGWPGWKKKTEDVEVQGFVQFVSKKFVIRSATLSSHLFERMTISQIIMFWYFSIKKNKERNIIKLTKTLVVTTSGGGRPILAL